MNSALSNKLSLIFSSSSKGYPVLYTHHTLSAIGAGDLKNELALAMLSLNVLRLHAIGAGDLKNELALASGQRQQGLRSTTVLTANP